MSHVSVTGVDGDEDLGVLRHVIRAERTEGQKPDDHHGAEELADALGPAALDEEEAEENRARDRDDVLLEARRLGADPFDRGEHADRGRDHPVAVEQRRACDDEERDEADGSTATAHALRREGEEGEDAALALVVGAHHEDEVLHGHHERQ